VADDKIIISIELDDGKVIKGLAKIEGSVKKAGKETKGLGEDIEDAFSGTAIGNATNSLNGFVSKIKSIHPAILAVAGAVAATGAAFATALDGEKIASINKQFDLLGSQAGVSLGKLREGLKSAADGTVDFEDILKSSNKFIVEFGKNAERLPEVLDLARKATALFGGEVTQNFEQISQAIATGQTRSLRSLGIIIDQEEAYKKFAQSIGTTAGALSEAGRRQAILDAVLQQGGETFKNVDPSVNQLSTSVTKLKVQLGDLYDVVAEKSNSTFGSSFSNLINRASEALERFNLAIKPQETGINGVADSIRKLELDLKSLNSTIEGNQRLLAQSGGIGQDALKTANENLISQREKLQADLERLQQRQLSAGQAASRQAPTTETPDNNPAFVDPTKVAANQAQITQLILTAHQDRINSQLQLATGDEERRKLMEEQKGVQIQLEQQKINDIQRLYYDTGLIDLQTFEMLKTEIVQKGNDERLKSTVETQNKMKVASIVSAQNINQGVSSAIQATVLAVKKGQSALKAFGSSILGFIGDIMIQIGTSVLGIGQAMEAIRASIVGMTGGPAIFAGIALIALGTLLKSLSGGGGESGGGGIGTGGAGGATSTAVEQPEIEEQKPMTQVAINVQGDVLDSRDTGMRIVDLIKEYTDRNGRTEVLA
jgi:hypothetical protein